MAKELAVTLEGAGIETEVVDMEDADPGLLNGSRAVVFCTETYRSGKLPDNASDFFEMLGEEWPDLEGVLYSVCGIEASIRPGFCKGSRIWSALLADLGATEVIERYEIDGFPDKEDIGGACEWVERAAVKFGELTKARVQPRKETQA